MLLYLLVYSHRSFFTIIYFRASVWEASTSFFLYPFFRARCTRSRKVASFRTWVNRMNQRCSLKRDKLAKYSHICTYIAFSDNVHGRSYYGSHASGSSDPDDPWDDPKRASPKCCYRDVVWDTYTLKTVIQLCPAPEASYKKKKRLGIDEPTGEPLDVKNSD